MIMFFLSFRNFCVLLLRCSFAEDEVSKIILSVKLRLKVCIKRRMRTQTKVRGVGRRETHTHVSFLWCLPPSFPFTDHSSLTLSLTCASFRRNVLYFGAIGIIPFNSPSQENCKNSFTENCWNSYYLLEENKEIKLFAFFVVELIMFLKRVTTK